LDEAIAPMVIAEFYDNSLIFVLAKGRRMTAKREGKPAQKGPIEVTKRRKKGSVGEALGAAGLSFGCFFLAILGRRTGFERAEEAVRDGGNFVDGRLEGFFVRLGWLIKACDFSHELQRSGVHFVVGDRRIEIEECSYISAHGSARFTKRNECPQRRIAKVQPEPE
jgi:hypothetical protein